MASFSSLKAILQDVFGHAEFRSGQLEASSAILHGQDVLARMTTGAGKSLCYQLPTIAMTKKCCLVISPLNALMNDQVVA